MNNPFEQNATRSNIGLPDELATLRAHIKELKEREGLLVDQIKEVGDCVGAHFEAVVQKTVRRSLNSKAVQEAFGEQLDEYYRETEVVSVKLKERQ